MPGPPVRQNLSEDPPLATALDISWCPGPVQTPDPFLVAEIDSRHLLSILKRNPEAGTAKEKAKGLTVWTLPPAFPLSFLSMQLLLGVDLRGHWGESQWVLEKLKACV